MTARLLALPCALLLVAACATASSEGVLLGEREIGRGWDVVREASIDPSKDRDLLEWGVLEKHARHYSRDLRGNVEVCSVEVWAFRSVEQARAAHGGFSFPDWQISRAGSLLVMVRGLVRGRGRPPVRGVFPDCDRIGARIVGRAEGH